MENKMEKPSEELLIKSLEDNGYTDAATHIRVWGYVNEADIPLVKSLITEELNKGAIDDLRNNRVGLMTNVNNSLNNSLNIPQGQVNRMNNFVKPGYGNRERPEMGVDRQIASQVGNPESSMKIENKKPEASVRMPDKTRDMLAAIDPNWHQDPEMRELYAKNKAREIHENSEDSDGMSFANDPHLIAAEIAHNAMAKKYGTHSWLSHPDAGLRFGEHRALEQAGHADPDKVMNEKYGNDWHIHPDANARMEEDNDVRGGVFKKLEQHGYDIR